MFRVSTHEEFIKLLSSEIPNLDFSRVDSLNQIKIIFVIEKLIGRRIQLNELKDINLLSSKSAFEFVQKNQQRG